MIRRFTLWLKSKNRTIKKDLLMLLVGAVTVPFILVTILYITNLRRVVNSDVINYKKAIIRQASDNLNNIFTSVKNIQRATMGKVISDDINNNTLNDLKDLIEFLYITDNANNNVKGIYVIFDNGNIVSSRLGIRDEILLKTEWIENIANRTGDFYTTEHLADYNVATKRDQYDRVISYVQRFTLPERRGTKITIQIDIELSVFQGFINSQNAEEKIPMVLLDSKSGQPLLKNSSYSDLEDSITKRDSVIITEIKSEHLYLNAYIIRDLIFNQFKAAIFGTAFIVFLLIILAILMGTYITKSITSPIHSLYLNMKSVGKGDFAPEYPNTKYSEMDFLIKRFKTMVEEIDTLIATVVSKENEASEAKFQALQAKINPHFLYNTLDVIRGLALEVDNHDISDMTLSLSRLFRYNVGNSKKDNLLKTEIEYLKDYINIQNYRFQDRIRTRIIIPEECENIIITQFILQPIVENAYKYGLELIEVDGVLVIEATKDSSYLYLSVFNNGPAIDSKELLKLKNKLSLSPDIKRVKSARGIDNVNLRIKLLYGNNYGISVESVDDCGTTVTIKLPIIKDKMC